MKTYKTIGVYKAVWAILRELHLDQIMTGIKEGVVDIPFTKILDELLMNDQLVNFCRAATKEEQYICDDGAKMPWEEIELSTAMEIITSFFADMAPMLKELATLGATVAEEEGNREQGTGNRTEQSPSSTE
jgi:hypothetical protein